MRDPNLISKLIWFLMDYRVSLMMDDFKGGLKELVITFLDGMGYSDAEVSWETLNEFRVTGKGRKNDVVVFASVHSIDFKKKKMTVKLYDGEDEQTTTVDTMEL
jgi:hypothetical protein